MVDVEQVFELLDSNVRLWYNHFSQEQTPEVPNPKTVPNQEHIEIEFKDVSFSYDKKKPVEEREMILDRISFKIKAGDDVALVGSTGSGKSTILRLLYRFYEIDEGQILLNGVDIRDIAVFDLRKMIGIVPQDCILFNDTLKYNIAYGGIADPYIKDLIDNYPTDKNKDKQLLERIENVARRAQIHSIVMNKRDKYDTKVGERGLKLSGGEKQRVSEVILILLGGNCKSSHEEKFNHVL